MRARVCVCIREKQKNPKIYLKEHPRWQFIQDLENFTAEVCRTTRKLLGNDSQMTQNCPSADLDLFSLGRNMLGPVR